MKEFKMRYNNLIGREKKATLFFEDESIDIETRVKWVDKYSELVAEIGKMYKEYTVITGINMTEEEFQHGFKKID